jgi:hypothetical protein
MKSSVKVSCTYTTDGVALVTYAEIGRVNDAQMSRWVCRTLGDINLPLEYSLMYISNAA